MCARCQPYGHTCAQTPGGSPAFTLLIVVMVTVALAATANAAGQPAAGSSPKGPAAGQSMATRPSGSSAAARCAGPAYDVGFRGKPLETVTAVGMAESGCVYSKRCHNCIPGYREDSRCAFQINIVAHPRYRQVQLSRPAACARAAWEVSGHGATFEPWSTWKDGKYRRFLPAARAAITPARMCPLPTGRFTDTWGAARSGGRSHKGTDVFAPKGTRILAFEGGRVIKVSNRDEGLGGLTVWVESARGAAYYAHNSRNVVRVGQQVRAGEALALVGNSGNARTTPSHLHFGYRPGSYRGGWANPYQALAEACGQRRA